jgi:hypothetical protein
MLSVPWGCAPPEIVSQRRRARRALEKGGNIVNGLIVAAVVVGVGLVWSWWEDSGAKTASKWWNKEHQQRAVRTGAGILPAAQPLAQWLSHTCRDGHHNRCSGLIATRSTLRHCDCSCHATAVTRFCAELNRHDLCPGAVVVVGGVAPCGCTCHPRQPIVERTTQITYDHSSRN